MIYQWLGGGEGDPEYIMLVDIQNKQKFTIDKVQRGFGPNLRQIAWYSAR